MPQDSIEDVLVRLDVVCDPIDEHQIDTAIRQFEVKDTNLDASPEHKAERIAFRFDERPTKHKDGSYKWFPPLDKSGRTNKDPQIESVDEQMLDYWANRARQAKNPVLRARYAGLVWECTPIILGKTADIDMARIRIDAVIELATDDRHGTPVYVLHKLRHTFGIALSINDADRVAKMRDTIIAYEKRVGKDDKAGLWGYGYDLLIENRKSGVTEDQKYTIISELEGRLERNSDPGSGVFAPYAAKDAATRLAKHYHLNEDAANKKRVLLKVGNAFDHMIEQGNALQAQGWLQVVHELYRNFGMSEEASVLRVRIRELGPAVQDCLVPISSTVEIPNDEIEKYVNHICEIDLKTGLERLLLLELPRRKDVKDTVTHISKKSFLASFFQPSLLGDEGRPIGKLGSLEDGGDDQLIRHLVQSFQIGGLYMRLSIEELIKKFGLDSASTLEWLEECPLFPEDKLPILERGLEAYFSGDHIVAVHLLVPQIEDAIRRLVQNRGGDIYKPNNMDGMNLRLLGDLLRDDLLKQVLGDDVLLYLKAVYTEPAGLNLRNHLCHGMLPAKALNQQIADRVFHTLLVMGVIRSKPEGEAVAPVKDPHDEVNIPKPGNEGEGTPEPPQAD